MIMMIDNTLKSTPQSRVVKVDRIVERIVETQYANIRH